MCSALVMAMFPVMALLHLDDAFKVLDRVARLKDAVFIPADDQLAACRRTLISWVEWAQALSSPP